MKKQTIQKQMKRQTIQTVIVFTCVFVGLLFNTFQLHSIKENSMQTKELLLDLIICDTNKIDIKITDWHNFIDAMIYVESGNNSLAVGKDNDAGVLQITPVYVEEVNRLLGEKKYTLKDRFDEYKSIEMFNIMNDKYNHERCFYKAMRLHNPNASESYKRKILYKYEQLKNNNL